MEAPGSGTDDRTRALWTLIKDILPGHDEFRYEPLAYEDEIRLLYLRPGKGNEPIVGYVKHIRLSAEDTAEYLALSYYWGDDDADKEIHVTAASARTLPELGRDVYRKKFKVRPNLFEALQNIRQPQKETPVWTDAICINQNDLQERSTQVERMGEVYAAASQVFVWLGPGESEDVERETFQDLEKFLDLDKFEKMTKDQINIESWVRIVKLMNTEWFSRRWVIQELALAKLATVHFGKAYMGWPQFAQAISLFIKKYDDISEPLAERLKPGSYKPYHLDMDPSGANLLVDLTTRLFHNDQHHVLRQKRLTLEALVSTLLPYGARNPRDTIFALLGMAKDTSGTTASPTNSLDPRVKPVYRKCVLDVYTDFMDYCIQTSNSLDIMCRYWAPPPEGPKLTQKQLLFHTVIEGAPVSSEPLPSWVPSLKKSAFGIRENDNTGRQNADSLVGISNRQNHQCYNASADILPEWRFGKHRAQATSPSLQDKSDLSAQRTRKRKRGCEASTATESRRASLRNQPVRTAETSFTPVRAGPSRTTENSVQDAYPSEEEMEREEPHVYTGVFTVKGIEVGTIDRCVEHSAAGAQIFTDALELFGWSDDTKVMKHFEDFWRTIAADRGPHGINIPAWYAAACREALKHYHSGLGCLSVAGLCHKWPGAPSILKEYLKRVEAVIWGRKFIKMKPRIDRHHQEVKSDCFGHAPGDAKAGDIVCILFGCSVPVVLRKRDDPGLDAYTFIGECYVHGIMDGEAVQRFSRRQAGKNPAVPGSMCFHLK